MPPHNSSVPKHLPVTNDGSTYLQAWAAYNEAQCVEKARFRSLLADLCSAIDEPEEQDQKAPPRLQHLRRDTQHP